ncbi:hypothetical protein GWK47_006169 [Chionoecetes opilio]|uniref:Uncharacterized protein n=1 Tax=Chionoecetes opilio TaxID=41210 RepID=A0A8J4YEQ9_CHIOP|nr:hypothetical protein GWK47_006169 [Chionoecetes opilio]
MSDLVDDSSQYSDEVDDEGTWGCSSYPFAAKNQGGDFVLVQTSSRNPRVLPGVPFAHENLGPRQSVSQVRRIRMPYQRQGKTYLSAAQKAEKQVVEEAEDEEAVKRSRRRLRRRPAPRFSDLFIKKKKENEKDESSGQSKENISLYTTGTEVKKHGSQASRKPLGVNNSLTSSTHSGPSFNDTFEWLCLKNRSRSPSLCAPSLPLRASQTAVGYCSSPCCPLCPAGQLTESTSLSSRFRNRENDVQQNDNDKAKPGKELDVSPSKETQKPSTVPVYSPQLFTSTDMVIVSESKASITPSPQPKTRALRQRTRGSRHTTGNGQQELQKQCHR